MKRILLSLLLVLLLTETTFGWEFSLGPGLSLKNALLYVILGVFTIEAAIYHNLRFQSRSVLTPFGLYVVYGCFSYFIAAFVVHPNYYQIVTAGIMVKGRLLDYFIIFLLFFYGTNSSESTLKLVRFFLWIVIAGNILTVVDGFDIPDLGIIQQREDGRLGGPMGESNQYGAFLAFTVPAVIALYWDPRVRKVIAIPAILISVLALLVASSRGSFVGLVVGGLFSAFFLRAYISMRQVAFGAIAASVFLVVMFYLLLNTQLAGDLVERFMDKATAGDTATISSGRTVIWQTALSRMLEHPSTLLTGYGFNAYDYMGFRFNSHNTFLNVFYNLGLPGLVFYVAIIYNIVAQCRRGIAAATGSVRAHLIAFVFGYSALYVSLFFVDLYAPWMFIWAFAGLALRLATDASHAEVEVEEESPKQSSALLY